MLRQRLNRPITSGSFQLGVLLHQLLQAEARELYRNLRFFAFSLALVNRTLAILGMPNPLSGAKSALTRGLFDRRFRDGKLLAAAGEELRDVLNRVVQAARGRGLRGPSVAAALRRTPSCTLIFVFVRIVARLGVMECWASSRWTGECLP